MMEGTFSPSTVDVGAWWSSSAVLDPFNFRFDPSPFCRTALQRLDPSSARAFPPFAAVLVLLLTGRLSWLGWNLLTPHPWRLVFWKGPMRPVYDVQGAL